MKTRACKQCKALTTEQQCHVCKSNSFANNWQGRIAFLNIEKSFIAKQVSAEKEAEYAIKVR